MAECHDGCNVSSVINRFVGRTMVGWPGDMASDEESQIRDMVRHQSSRRTSAPRETHPDLTRRDKAAKEDPSVMAASTGSGRPRRRRKRKAIPTTTNPGMMYMLNSTGYASATRLWGAP